MGRMSVRCSRRSIESTEESSRKLALTWARTFSVMNRDRRRWDPGLLVDVQVKAGRQDFEPEHDEAGAVRGWWFRDSGRAHLDACVGHGLPHLLVLHDLDTRISSWAHVTAASVVASGAGAKVLVPAANTVDDDEHRDTLRRHVEPGADALAARRSD
jgi:hypothetical protein